jgi:hypothetical protein
MKDYRIKLTIRNDRLLSAMESMGHPSVMSFCKKYNLPYTSTNLIVSGKHAPLRKNGKLTKECQRLLDLLGLDVEEAFTERQREGFSRTTFETKVEEKQLLQLVNPAKNQEIKAIESDVSSKIGEIMSNCLTPREERVIRMRYGLNPDKHCYTLEEVGLEFKATKERVRQIEVRALDKFRKIKNSRDLLNTGFYETFTSVNVKPKQIEDANFFANVESEEKKKKIDYRNQISKQTQRNINRFNNIINKSKKFNNYKKEQIRNWIKKTLGTLEEGKHFLKFESLWGMRSYTDTWMYKQIKSIIREVEKIEMIKWDEKLDEEAKKLRDKVYEKAKKLRDKLKTRTYVALESHIILNKNVQVKKFIYYKNKGEKNDRHK